MEKSSIRNIRGFRKYDWIKTVYRLIEKNEWIPAEQLFMDLSGWSEKYVDSFDLKILCNINKVQQHGWVVYFILELLNNGSDYHSLYIEKGESFLHACIRLTLATGMYKIYIYTYNQICEQ